MTIPAAGFTTVEAPQRRLSTALGTAAAGLLVLSLAFPYWQARLFAPQYRDGLTAKMYAFRVTGDVSEIDGLNHYIGMRKLKDLALLERRAAVPSVLALAAFCLFAFRSTARWLREIAAAAGVFYPAAFVADMAFWMRWATTHLDSTAPLKLKPFAIPVLGAGRVAQFRSEMGPQLGYFLAVLAAGLLVAGCWLSRAERREPREPALGAKRGALALLALLAAVSSARGETLQQRVDAAPAGSVVEVPSGTHAGPLVIAKALTLRGAPGAVIEGGGRGTVVTIKASGVTLEGLEISGSGDTLLYEDAGVRVEAASAAIRGCLLQDVLFGAFLVHAPGAVIERTRMAGKPISIGRRGDLIRGWNSDALVVRGNHLQGGRDFVLWFSTGSIVEDNVMEAGRYGLHFMYTNNARVRGNVFRGNSVGFYLMYSKGVTIERNVFERHRGPSGAGLGLKESGWITVTGNAFVGNRQGVYVDGSPLVAEEPNVYTKNIFAANDVGVAMLPGVVGNTFYDNAFVDNLTQVSERGGGGLRGNAWSREGRGNFWSDYAGYGAAGAAVGRLPYRVESAWQRLADSHPISRFFMFTPAAQAVETAARAFPVFRPKAILIDPVPLLAPPPGLPQPPPAAEAGWALPFGLLSLSGLLLGLPSLARRSAVSACVGSPAEAGPALTAHSLRKSYDGRLALDVARLEVAAGTCLALWGPNGSGKSTFLKCALGLQPFEGVLEVAGIDPRRDGAGARKAIGYVAQDFAGYDWTVAEAMEFVARLRGAPEARVEEALSVCGLRAERDKRLLALSGGMKQKLSLAQALVADPKILLLDEPCSNLDARSRRDLLHILQGLKGCRTLVLTSHRVEEVALLADLVLWLEAGLPARLLTVDEFSREAEANRLLEA